MVRRVTICWNVITVWMACYALAAAAQVTDEPRFVTRTWTTEDGLPVNQITGLVQGEEGYLWMATFDGLVRFDGVHFTLYTTGNSEGLPSNRIVSVEVARGGGLWLLTEQDQVVRFRDGAFTAYPLAASGQRTNAMLEAPSGTVWLAATGGAYALQGERFVLESGSRPVNVVSLHVEPSGVAWLGTEGSGLMRVSDAGIRTFAMADGIPPGRVTAVRGDPEGRIWFSADGRLFRIDGGPPERVALGTSEPLGDVTGITFRPTNDDVVLESLNGTWLLTEDGARRVGPPRQAIVRPRLSTFGPTGALWFGVDNRLLRDGVEVLTTPAGVSSILHDHEGNVWVAGGGLHQLRRALFTQRGEDEGLLDNIYPILESRDGALWFGSLGGGLARLHEGTVTRFDESANAVPELVQSVFEDDEGGIWVGSWGGPGACRLVGDVCDGTYRGVSDRLGGHIVRAIHQAGDGALWFGTGTGAYRLSSGGAWRRFTDELPHVDVRLITDAPDGAMWMGTYGGGLVRVSDDAWTVIDSSDGLSSDLVRSLHVDEAGVLWIGSEGNGLNRLEWSERSGPTVAVYRRADGLYDDGIHQIVEDGYGRLWMSSNRGVFWVEKAELEGFAAGRVDLLHSTFYTESDGLEDREMNGGVQGAGVLAGDGRLWMPGIAGAAVVSTDSIRRNEVPPPVQVEAIVSGEEFFRGSSEVVRLAPEQRNFEVRYTALSFAAPENVRFRYRLEGFDDDWVDVGNRRSAFYTNVPPGEYSFRVVAANNAGVWNERGAALSVVVAPFFYESGWFFGLLALSLAGVATLALRLRERRLRAQAGRLQALVDERTTQLAAETQSAHRARASAEEHRKVAEQALRTVEAQAKELEALDRTKSRFYANVSHEFRTPLTLLIGPLEDVRDGIRGEVPEGAREDIDLALRNSRRLLKLVNQILDVAKLEAGQMDLQARVEDLRPLVRRLHEAFLPLAKRRAIDLRASVPEAPVLVRFDEDLIEKAVTNLLSNACKFAGEGGAVRLGLEVVDDVDGRLARVEVRDNGPGIPEKDLSHVFERFYQVDSGSELQEAGTGIGLSLAYELIELHGGRIWVESDLGFGSTFFFTLPVVAEASEGAAAVPDVSPRRAGRAPGSVAPELSGPDVVATGVSGGEDGPAPEVDPDVPVVLIADDHPDLRAFVRRQLEPAFRVVEAADGIAAYREATESLPDLVLSDVMMPGMDGFELCRRIKADPELTFIPVVILTARAEAEDRIEGLEAGADDVMSKPFDASELQARIENLIEARKRLRSRQATAIDLRPSSMEVVSKEARFLDRLKAVVEEHIDDPDLDVETLGRKLGHSRSSLYRKLAKADAGTPAELIRAIRLERAAVLLQGRAGSVSEIAYGVGFKSVSHFTRCFRERFGLTPSRFRDDRETVEID